MPFKVLLTSRTISRWAVYSVVPVLLVLRYAVRDPFSAEAVSTTPSAPAVTFLGPSQLPFTPCWLEGSPEQVLCGSYHVYENRQSHRGHQISLRIAVLPALR